MKVERTDEFCPLLKSQCRKDCALYMGDGEGCAISTIARRHTWT